MKSRRLIGVILTLWLSCSSLWAQQSHEYVTACNEYTWHGTTYTVSGEYEHHMYNMAGGDSVITLHLQLYKDTLINRIVTACDYYEWEGLRYTESGVYFRYYQSIHECDSTLRLELTIRHSDSIVQNIDACESYDWRGNLYTESGTYVDSFTNAAGCDSLFILHLTIHHTVRDTIYKEACDVFEWQGTTYQESGVYLYHQERLYHGCNSLCYLNLQIHRSVDTTIYLSACESIVLNDSIYTQSGVYQQEFTTTHNCDSIVNYDVTIYEAFRDTLSVETCDLYEWRGIVYKESGFYKIEDTTRYGCDSIYCLDLTLHQSVRDTIRDAACYEYEWFGEIYTESDTITHADTTQWGCERLTTLLLTIHQDNSDTLTVTECDSYTWMGTTYTESGTYHDTLTTAAGCDSLLTLLLTVNSSYNDTLSFSANNYYLWNGDSIVESGFYTQSFISSSGCDSIVTINIVIEDLSTEIIITGCGGIEWNGVYYDSTTTITEIHTDPITGADSIYYITLDIGYPSLDTLYEGATGQYEWNGITYTESGTYSHTYTAVTGCDSTIVLILIIYKESASIYFFGDFTMCNNIIANNRNASTSNIESYTDYNIIVSGEVDFLDVNYDYRLQQSFTEAINMGNNDCVTVGRDLYGELRIMDGTVEIGAYEMPAAPVLEAEPPHLIYFESSNPLTFCNNIISFNRDASIENLDNTEAYNIITEEQVDFMDINLDLRLQESFTEAINTGNNACVTVERDLYGELRISEEIVELGAYEKTPPPPLDSTIVHLIYFEHSDPLMLCNNIITFNRDASLENLDTNAAYNIITTEQLSGFLDYNIDLRLEPSFVEAINTGNNSCVTVERDLYGNIRVLENIVELGAYEVLPPPELDTIAAQLIYFENDAPLTFCNNIITFNRDATIDNLDSTLAYNIITTERLNGFLDYNIDLRLEPSFVEAINTGNNDCVTVERDLYGNVRISENIVELGAYEVLPPPELDTNELCVIYFENGAPLTFCNNIITFNRDATIDNLDSTLAYNIITTERLSGFLDYNVDLRLEPSFVEAINTGNNDCVTAARDLYGNLRIMEEIVELGAYEVLPDPIYDTAAAVFEIADGGSLRMYNTIVINNGGAYQQAFMTNIPPNNLVADTASVFIDSLTNYNLIEGCLVENGGDNQYVDFEKDMDGEERIACESIVDIGAYEIQHETPVVSFTVGTLDNVACNTSLVTLTAHGGDTYLWEHSGNTDSTIVIDGGTQNTYTVTVSTSGCSVTDAYTFIPDINPYDQEILPSTFGKEFWVSFGKNFSGSSTLTLIATADSAATGRVENPRTGWSTTFTVPERGMTNIEIPTEQAYCTESEVVSDLGLVVTTDKDISLFASNFQDFSYDVANILPVHSLGRSYTIQTYTPMMAGEFVIVATEDDTEVEITPSARTAGGNFAHVPFTVTLQRGQVYQVLSHSGGSTGDLSGSTVKSLTIGKKIAVFNGNVCAAVEEGTSFCDHLYEQAFATQYWGRTFALTSTALTSYNMVDVLASYNGTEVQIDGQLVATLQSGQHHRFQLTAAQGTCLVETSRPAAVYMYLNGAMNNAGQLGDPSMTWVAPFEQSINRIIFGTFQTPQIQHHYVNVVTKTSDVGGIRLDGTSLAGEFSPMPSSPEYSFVRKEIQHGMHELVGDSNFTAYVYGLGTNESYAYSAGSRVMPATQEMYINDVLSQQANTSFCAYDQIEFRAEISYPYDSLTWDLGDGTLIHNEEEFTHFYTEAGSYPVDMTIFTSPDGSLDCYLIRAVINIKENSVQTIDTTLCLGDVYQDNNFDFTATEAGDFTFPMRFSYEDTTLTCDSLIVLNVHVRTDSLTIQDTICLGETYSLHGFSVTPTEAGLYTETTIVPVTASCDSTTILELWVNDNSNEEIAIQGPQDVCLDNSFGYSVPDRFSEYEWELPTGAICIEGNGTDSVTIYFNELMTGGSISVTMDNGCAVQTATLEIFPHENYYQIYEDTVCEGSAYADHGFYIDTVKLGESSFIHSEVSQYGCDSTVVLNLTIHPLPDTVFIADTICAGADYLQHDFAIAADSLPEDGTYTRTDTMLSVTGCDSIVVLTLTVLPVSETILESITIVENQLPYTWHGVTFHEAGGITDTLTAANGCDSLVTMELVVLYNTHITVDSTICKNDLPLTWNDSTFHHEDTITTTLLTNNGADSIITMVLHVNPNTGDTLVQNIVENQLPYPWNDTLFTEADTIVTIIPNANGCDSVVTMILNVWENVNAVDDSTICESALPIVWNGVEFAEAGTQVAVLTSSVGADSVVTMTLHVQPNTYGAAVRFVVENQLPLTWNGVEFTGAGTQSATLAGANANGCDSVVTMTLFVHENVEVALDSTICESALPLTWNDSIFTEADTITTTILMHTGADSTITMRLHVLPVAYSTLTDTVVENDLPYPWNGVIFEHADTLTATLAGANANGCDSIITMMLFVHENVETTLDSTICENDLPLTWNDSTFHHADTISTTVLAHTGADSIITMRLHVNPNTYSVLTDTADANIFPFDWNGATFTTAGTQTAIIPNTNGCDSVVTMTVHCRITLDSTVCENDLPLIWNDSTFHHEDTITTTLLTNNGADSIITMVLHVNLNTGDTLVQNIVENQLPYPWNDTLFTEADTIVTIIPNANGCDSVIVMILNVWENVETTIDSTICENDLPIIWNGVEFAEAGTQVAVLTNSVGADSVVTMTLHVTPTTYSTLSDTVVENQLPHPWNGVTFTSADTLTVTLVGANANNCDSIVTMVLHVHQNVEVALDSTVCESELPLTWNDSIFTEADTITTTILAHTGADSTITMRLHVLPVAYSTLTDTVVENDLTYPWNGVTFEHADTLTATLAGASANGCDSIITMMLFVHENVETTIDSTICENDLPLTWNDSTFHHADTISTTVLAHTGADSIITMRLHVNPNTYSVLTDTADANIFPFDWNGATFTTAGTQTAIIPNTNGCDSVVTMTVHCRITLDSTICENDLPLTWNDSTFYHEDTITTTLLTNNGADSIITMVLHVNPNTGDTLVQNIVENQLPYPWNDTLFTEADTIVTIISNANGCDSVIVMILNVWENVETTIDSTICEDELPLTWNDSIFHHEDTITTTILAHTGADSTITMVLHVIPTTYSTLIDTVVENDLPHEWNGVEFADADTITTIIPNAGGCDSIVTMVLHVLYNTHITLDSTICADGLPLQWGDDLFTAAGTQYDTLPAANGTDTVVAKVLAVNTLPDITFSGFTNPVCPFVEDSVVVTGTAANGLAPYSYSWSGDSLRSTQDNSATVSLLGTQCGDARRLTLTVTDANGCFATDSATILIEDETAPTVGTLPTQAALVSECLFTVPDLIALVRAASSDDCTPADSLSIVQQPAAGTEISTTTNVTITVTDRCGNEATATVQVTVPQPLSVSTTNITHILCHGESTGGAMASVTGGMAPYTYQWYAAANTAISTTASISNRPAGTYSVTVTDANGCTAADTVTLNTLNGEMLPGTISANQTVCQGSPAATLTGTAASGGDNATYQWQSSTNNANFSPAATPNGQQNYTPGNVAQTTYYRRAWISAECGTVYSNVVEITVLPTYADTVAGEVCQNHPYEGHGFSVPEGETHDVGLLTRTRNLQSAHGCDSIVTLLLTVNPSTHAFDTVTLCASELPYHYAPADTTFQEGTAAVSDHSFALPTATGCDSVFNLHLVILPTYRTEEALTLCESELPYHYAPADTIFLPGTTDAEFSFRLTTESGCDSVIVLQLEIIDTALQVVSLTEDFCENFEAVLTVSGTLADYLWSTGETTQEITVTQPGTYSVSASEGDCGAVAQISIEPCEFNLFLPNAITPGNPDGLNDYFHIQERIQSQIGNFEIDIFNRWGECVFRSTDKGFRWNGEYRGRINTNVIYSYIIRCTNLRGEKFLFKGSITVL